MSSYAPPVRPSTDSPSERDDSGVLGPRPQSTTVQAEPGSSPLRPAAREQEGRLRGRRRPPPPRGPAWLAAHPVASVATPLPSRNAGRQRRFWLFQTGGRRSRSQGPPRRLKQDGAEGQAQRVPRWDRTATLSAGGGDAGTRCGSNPPGGSQTWPSSPE